MALLLAARPRGWLLGLPAAARRCRPACILDAVAALVRPRHGSQLHCVPCKASGTQGSATAAVAASGAARRRRPHSVARQQLRCLAAASAADLSALSTSPRTLPTVALGKVMSAASNYVRVEVDELLDEAGSEADALATAADDDGTQPITSGRGEAAAAAGANGARQQRRWRLPRRQLLCSLRSLLKKMNQTVLVGDRVQVAAIDWAAGRAVVTGVLPRTSELADPAVANVDHVLLVFALAQPPFEEVQVTRFLVAAEASGLPFTLVLNKSDLVPPETLAARVAQCRGWGYEPLVISCDAGEGVGAVAELLSGRTAVVAGPSGAGKSSLINTLRLGVHRADRVDSDNPSILPSLAAFDPVRWAADSGATAAAEAAAGAAAAAAAAALGADGGAVWGTTSGGRSSGSSGSGEGGGGAATPAFYDPWLGSGSGRRRGRSEGDGMDGVDDGDEMYDDDDEEEEEEEAGEEGGGAGADDWGAGQGGRRRGPGGLAVEVVETPKSRDARRGRLVSSLGSLSSSGGFLDGPEGGGMSEGSGGEESMAFLPVGEVSKMGRGKHTTTSVALIPLPGGGLLADTPGLGLPTLEGISSSDLWLHFPEFSAVLERDGPCRFSNCLHAAEPGCRVTAALLERHPLYIKTLNEVQILEEYDERLMQQGKRQREGLVKVKAGKGGVRRVEARLDARKHRQTSRKSIRQRLITSLDD